MKCPNCGFDKILPMYKVCPKCKQPLTNAGADSAAKKAEINETPENVDPLPTSSNVKSDVGTVATQNNSHNYVTWTIAPGQIARNISVQEFAALSGVDGVYIQEGVTAVIFVDGEKIEELDGGLYKFVSARVKGEAALQYAEDEADKRAHESIIRQIGRVGQSLLHLVFGQSERSRRAEYIKRREAIKELSKKITGNSVVSAVLKRNGAIQVTMGIRPTTAEDGSVQMEFAPYKIHTQSLTVDVAVALEARITDFKEFRTTYLMDRNSYSANDFRVALNTFMRTTLQRSMQHYAADGDLLPQDLMTSISYELMTQSAALLHGISISNVLDITTDNEAFDRFRALEEKLFCTDKEIDYLSRTNEFKNRLQTVENQQKVAEAKSELDLRKELDQINNDQLIHEDEMEAFVQLLQSQKRIREAQTENDELAALLKLKGNRLVTEDEYDVIESSIKDKKFDREQVSATFQLTSAHRTEMARVQLNAELQKNKLLAEAELNDIRFVNVRKELEQKLQLAEMQETHDLASTQRKDNYADVRREKELEFAKRKQDIEMDLLRQKAELARQNMEAMQAHEKDLADKKHEEEMMRMTVQQNMTAEQIMAAGASGLSAEAQKAFADALAVGKGTDKEREMYERMLQMQADMTNKIVDSQATQQKVTLDAIQQVAGARIAQSDAIKEEYRKQMEHEQKRTDTAQDRALNYTTKVTQEEIKAAAKTGKTSNNEVSYYLPDFGAEYSLKEVGNLILNGTISPDTDIEVDGTTVSIAEVDELFPFLEKKYGNA